MGEEFFSDKIKTIFDTESLTKECDDERFCLDVTNTYSNVEQELIF